MENQQNIWCISEKHIKKCCVVFKTTQHFFIYSASKGKVYGFARGFDSADSTGISGRPGPSLKYISLIHMTDTI